MAAHERDRPRPVPSHCRRSYWRVTTPYTLTLTGAGRHYPALVWFAKTCGEESQIHVCQRLVPPIVICLLLVACAVPPISGTQHITLPTAIDTPDAYYLSDGGGEPRSPGYWMIWSTCAEGNQAAVAQANGGREAGWILLDDLLGDPGIVLGSFPVETCQAAVNLLQGRDVDGQEMADDVVYALVAQLLAAELNIGAGAEICPAVLDAAIAAEKLLVELSFDGIGAYLDSQDPRNSRVLDLVNTLSRYNSGNLCK